jgi:queuine tRNA-ribosyltransferase
LGILHTSHGDVVTPTLVPVATQGTIKTLWTRPVELTKTQLVIANTFHLHLKPGEKIVQNMGGLHEYMRWPHPIMTDSAGYQVFSLGFGSDLQLGKIMRKKSSKGLVQLHQQPQRVKITERGVFFRSPVDGRRLFIGPRESMQIQAKLGADIAFAFDECTPPVASKAYTRQSLERTHRWAVDSLAYRDPKQALYGIVQGGRFKDLRKKSSQFVAKLPFDGFGIGGEFGANKQSMIDMLALVLKELPATKPRHLLGIGHLDDIPRIIKRGVDTFDCIVPTHLARRGIAFTRTNASDGRLDLNRAVFLRDKRPLDRHCGCFVCADYTRSYLSHLYKSREITALSLITFHNLFLFNTYVEQLREQIARGKL